MYGRHPELICWQTAPAKREAGVFLASPIIAEALIEVAGMNLSSGCVTGNAAVTLL
jgi:hypothetical protein